MSPRTIPLPAGTRNTSINAPVEWMSELSHLASVLGISQCETIRRAVEEKAERECPSIARKLRQSRLVVRVSVAITLGLTAWKLSTISVRESMPSPIPAIVETLDSIWMMRGGAR